MELRALLERRYLARIQELQAARSRRPTLPRADLAHLAERTLLLERLLHVAHELDRPDADLYHRLTLTHLGYVPPDVPLLATGAGASAEASETLRAWRDWLERAPEPESA